MMTKFVVFFPLVLFTAGQAVPMAAQQARAPRNMTVEITLIATGRNNVPVEDLAAKDITVKDNGKKQEIISFTKLSGGGPGPVGKPALHNIVLLDCLNTVFHDLPENRREILKVVNEVSKVDNVTFLVLRQNLKILHDFAISGPSLLRKFASQGGQGLETNAMLGAYDWVFTDALGLQDLFTRSGNYARRIDDSAAALRTIASNYRGRLGRKSLLWISQGFPVAPGGLPREVEFTHRLLNDANVAVYPIDARYLTEQNMLMSNTVTMEDVAKETGGLAFVSRKDVANSVREALNDTRTVYVLTYAISEVKNDGEFHAVSLATSRKDVKMRARKGYYAPSGK